MHEKFSSLKELLQQTFREWSQDNASRLAAALAYYTVFSIPPLLIIALAIAARFFDRATVRQQLMSQITELIGSQGADIVADILQNASQPGGTVIASIIGVVTLLFGASGVFGQLQSTLNRIWNVAPDPSQGLWATVKKRLFSFTMVLGVGFLLLVSLVLSAALATVSDLLTGLAPELITLAQAINAIVSFGVITLLFAIIFKVVPDAQIAWRDVWLGAAVTAVLFIVGRWLIGFYLTQAAPGSTYGAAGSLIVILVWVYYSAQILYLGAEFTQVYAYRYGSGVSPGDGAVRMTALPGASTALDRQQQLAPEQAQAHSAAALQPYLARSTEMEDQARPRRTKAFSPPQRLQSLVNRYHAMLVSVLAWPTALWHRSDSTD
ncbi:MAG: YihY/virulence factor BrkB family protein [Candidatus Promineifilaceae bacterium]|nr:YihY/virulence factor BrkB family protein [Candidatus Promineifilaceae bacterium]